MRGHVFVVQGDITQLSCDGWLVPTDDEFVVTASWRHVVTPLAAELNGQQPWGPDERVRLLDRNGDRQMWLGRIGARGRPANWYADGVREFVRVAGSTLLAEHAWSRPPMLAVSHVGTGSGGARDTKGEVLAALFDALHEVVVDVGVDVVVVSWDSRSHAAAQRARMQSLAAMGNDALTSAAGTWTFEGTDRTESLQHAAHMLADQAIGGRLALFMGAGVSAGAGLPGWAGLLAAIGASAVPAVTAAELAALDDPRDQAAFLGRRLGGERNLIDAVTKELNHQHHSLQHSLISSLPVREFTTTNFDELFEQAAQTNGRALRVLPVSDNSAGVEADRWLLKLHGTLTDPDSVVLTRSAYLDAPRQRGALFGLVQAMLMTRHMLFVGYGLRDETFHELVHEVRHARAGQADALLGTAITLFDDPVHAEIWQGDVEVVAVRPMPDPVDDIAIALAGRDVERLLDLVGLLAADRWGFLLDSEFSGMLSATDRELASLLGAVAEKVLPGDHRDGWRQVAELLSRFGAGSGVSPMPHDIDDEPVTSGTIGFGSQRLGDLVDGLADRKDDPRGVLGPLLSRALLPPQATWVDVADLSTHRIMAVPKMNSRRLDVLVERLRSQSSASGATTAASEVVPDSVFADPVEAARSLIDRFDDRDSAILVRVLDVTGSPPTLAAIGDHLDLTRERVRQVESGIRERLDGWTRAADMETLMERADQIRAVVGALAPLESVPMEMVPDPGSLVDELFAYLAGPYRIDGEWMLLSRYRSWLDVLDAAFASAQVNGVASREAMRDALESLEVDSGLLDRLVEQAHSYWAVGDSVILWTGSHGDRAARVLANHGAPLLFTDLVAAIGPGNERSFSNALHASTRLRRVGIQRWALSEWDMQTYEGLVPAMCERLAFGPRDTNELADELHDEFGTSPNSVRMYSLMSPLFIVEGGRVRLRTSAEPYESAAQLEDSDRCELVDGVWALRIPVDTDLLRGSGRQIPEAFAVHVGLQPLGDLTVGSDHGPIRFRWQNQPHVGSLRRIAEVLGGESGDDLLIFADAPERLSFRIRRSRPIGSDELED